ncbi:MAG TPA: DUF1583 domain-containing protein, partial [Pirellulales bacterium]|nr:DUF1583 domain-containing protein [Pirellulales bacterium]
MAPSDVPQWWAEHDGYLRCLSGKGNSALVFDYPLVGSGELSVDLLTGGAWGSFSYGGVLIAPRGLAFHDGTFPAMAIENIITPTGSALVKPDVNRWTLRIESGKNQVLNNGQLGYEIPGPSAAAPWLALCAWFRTDAAFRRLSISGDWRIPREVALVEGDCLVGWTGGFYDDAQTIRPAANVPIGRGGRRVAYGQRSTAPNDPAPSVPGAAFRLAPPRPANGGWFVKSGIIGAYVRTRDQATPDPIRLTYFRPLRNGEVLRYELFYQPGQQMVHPALDRLTFLLEPEGVRLHWMTDHPDAEAGDLSLDNVADEPDARRGPPRLPLVAGEWNRVALSLVDDEVVVELNGETIFRRKLEGTNDRLFSFFRYQNETSARVRNVALSGNWPEQIPQGDELFARTRQWTDAERQAESKLV